MDDLISRRKAIDATWEEPTYTDPLNVLTEVRDRLEALPSAQPEYWFDEWCTDCKEYDHERHCCPRFNRVIRSTLQEVQEERKKGKWEVHNILDYKQRPTGRKILRCPFCGYLTDDFKSRVGYYHKLTHFCPNCGAEMTGGEQDDEIFR